MCHYSLVSAYIFTFFDPLKQGHIAFGSNSKYLNCA